MDVYKTSIHLTTSERTLTDRANKNADYQT